MSDLITLAGEVTDAINTSGIVTATRTYLPLYTPTLTIVALVEPYGFNSLVQDRGENRVNYTISVSIIAKNKQNTLTNIDAFLGVSNSIRKLFAGNSLEEYACMNVVMSNPIVNEMLLNNENCLITQVLLTFMALEDIEEIGS